MSQRKNRKNEVKKLVIIMTLAIVLLVALVLFVGVTLGKNQANKGNAKENQIVQEEIQQEEVQDEQVIEKPVEEAEETFEVETNYCKLFYPCKWEEDMRIETSDSKVEFCGEIDGKENIHLFDVVFGEKVGFELGTLKTNGGNVSISIVSYELQFDDTWNEEEKNRMYAMQEDVNVIIQELGKNSDFEMKK